MYIFLKRKFEKILFLKHYLIFSLKREVESERGVERERGITKGRDIQRRNKFSS